MNRKQSTGNQRRTSRPTEQELRTPMAWQHRDINYQQQHHIYSERFGMVPEVGQMPGQYHYQNGSGHEQYGEEMSAVRGPTRNRPRSSNHRPQSPSTDTSTSNSTGDHDTESQQKYGDTLAHQDPRHGVNPHQAMGTLRSIQSTITTWDGEPCPVHHMAMPMQMQMQPMMLQPPPPHYPMLAMPPPPPPAVLLPPMLRPRPLVMPADAPAPPEPLPIRDPVSPLPPKDNNCNKSKSCQCCKGHIIVLWIILCIILTGVLLGIVLRFVFA